MDANTYSLKQVLTQDRRYIVPTFSAIMSGLRMDNGNFYSPTLRTPQIDFIKHASIPSHSESRQLRLIKAYRHIFLAPSFAINFPLKPVVLT